MVKDGFRDCILSKYSQIWTIGRFIDSPASGCKSRPSQACLIGSFVSSLPPVCDVAVLSLNSLSIVPGQRAERHKLNPID